VDLVRLWYHENMRVFHDRLVDDIDRNYFKELLKNQFTIFNMKEEEVLNCERVLYGDFYDGKDAEPRYYR
jgi:dynein heavy chain